MYLPLFRNVYDDVTDFEIWVFTKTQKPRYLENERFFFSNKKIIDYTSRPTLLEKIVL